MSQDLEIQYYHHGRFRVAGGVLPDAITAYQTFGDPKNPVIVFPTCYGGKLDTNGLLGQSYMVGEDKVTPYSLIVLDPRKYYVVTLALFSNGESSSPSNTPAPYNGPYFPTISYEDNAYYWPVMYPDFVERYIFDRSFSNFSLILVKIHPHLFLEGPKAALSASKDFQNGHYKSTPQHGIRAFGRAYSAWAYSQAWYAKKGYLFDGKYTSLNDFLREDWEGGFLEGWDANDLLTLLNTWQMGDVSLIRDGGYFANCLGAIKARGLIMPCKKDLYFPPEDCQNEMKFLNNAKLVIIDSEWGHMSGGGSNVQDDEFIQAEYYHHGRFKVAGGVLPDAVTAYRTYGDPSNDKVIVFPTCYGAKLALGSQDYLVGEGKVLDPNKYFVVTFALFCNGEPAPYDGPYFPFVSYEDNIRAQHAVLTKHLGVRKAFCVVGFSMGGQQAYHWPVVFPDFVERFVSICSSARTSPHNQCFLEGPKAAMLASKDFADGHYQSTPQHGIRAFGRVYSAWAYGQTWFREYKHLMDGEYPDLNSFIRERWEAGYVNNWDANDMIALLNTWQKGDISIVRDGGDYEKALKSIKAKGLIMPSKTDLYFPPEDSETEVSHLRNAKLHVIPSIWGHVAGGSANPQDVAFITEKIAEFLQAP
ncbi:Alpha/Beta hydrolase protein [Suillus clintonianus]|uniref:Alpha/Beta hydrolase protein n=1 Tax=Suillus clintonianus TaxID=1904413 RepID=UPI001B876C61|nr:Alpha/Beta hydrolase protein [Suillus clintonianus]KAG2150371.1 Alpha/Beta hydrolase protein [Suillus clintonianus]